jgi:hypothetical protein
MRSFFEQISPNLEGISRHNIFNYDETCFRDDPSAEDAFFSGGCKQFERSRSTARQ